MSMNDKKMQDAMRIFEALSGVDEELLARCEEDIGTEEVVKTKKFKKSRPVWYYGKVIAACLCFVVLGVALWAVGPLMSNNGKSTESATNFSAIQDAAMQDAAVAEECAEVEEAAADMGDTGGVSDAAMEKTDGTEQRQELEQTTNTITDGIAELESCPIDTSESITWDEAKQVTTLGGYVPDTIPSGYTFESANKSVNDTTGETERITLFWTKGMHDIMIVISTVNTSDIVTVDVSKPETYDVHQYEIPYAETVPEEYRNTFDDPVFAEKDFNLGIVDARMKVVVDQGDTDIPRGDFSVLYEDGILVRFNGDADAESVYEMFVSME